MGSRSRGNGASHGLVKRCIFWGLLLQQTEHDPGVLTACFTSMERLPVSLRFVHAADLHLDTPVSGLTVPPPGIASALRDASLDAFDALIDVTIEHDAAFLVLAGGSYDGPDAGLRAQVRVRDGLERLSSAGIQVFIVLGEADPAPSHWAAIPVWPDGVHVLDAAGGDAVPAERGGERVATLYGASIVDGQLRGPAARVDAPGVHIGILHLENDDAGQIDMDTLLPAGLDYWALGGSHAHAIHSEHPWTVSAGTIQGRSLQPCERGEKGATLVTAEDSAIREVRFLALDRIRFDEITVDVSSLDDLADVQHVLAETAATRYGASGGRGLVLSATLTGSGPIHDEANAAGATAALLQRLRDEAVTANPFLWWAALEDRTRREQDRQAIRARGDFSAQLLALGEAIRGDPERVRTVLDASLEDDATPFCGAALSELLSEAEALALDHLEARDEA